MFWYLQEDEALGANPRLQTVPAEAVEPETVHVDGRNQAYRRLQLVVLVRWIRSLWNKLGELNRLSQKGGEGECAKFSRDSPVTQSASSPPARRLHQHLVPGTLTAIWLPFQAEYRQCPDVPIP
jgi:hypothetical protein